MNAADTNVYVYALDADEPVKQAKALELFDRLVLQAADTVLIWQVAGEFLSQLRRWESKGELTPEEVQATERAPGLIRMAGVRRLRDSGRLR
jgi:predicted nucleic acid-binding protein